MTLGLVCRATVYSHTAFSLQWSRGCHSHWPQYKWCPSPVANAEALLIYAREPHPLNSVIWDCMEMPGEGWNSILVGFFLITNDFLASFYVLMIIFTSLSLLHASWSRPYFMTQPNLIQLTKSNPRDEGREREISESACSICPNNRRLQVATWYPWPQPASLQSMVNLHWKGTGLPVVLYGMCMFNGN